MDSTLLLQLLPRLDAFPKLEKLTLNNSWQTLDDLFPQVDKNSSVNGGSRMSRRREMDWDESDGGEESFDDEDSQSWDEDEDDMSEDDYDSEEEEYSARRSYFGIPKPCPRPETPAKIVQSALTALQKIAPRLTGLSMGTARHSKQLVALFDLLSPTNLRTLTFGISEGGEIRRKLQEEVSTRSFAKALDRFVNLEELTFGFRPYLVEDFSQHDFTFAKTLKRLKVHTPKCDGQLAEFVGSFQKLERLELIYHEDNASYSFAKPILTLPELTFLCVNTGITNDGELGGGILGTFRSFASAPKLDNILVEFTLDLDDYGGEMGEFDPSDMARLLLPLCSTDVFPSLKRVEFDEAAAGSLDSFVTKAKPEEIVPTRMDLSIRFRPSEWDATVSPYAPDRRLESEDCTESQRREFYLDESEALLRWGLREIENMRSAPRNHDKMGATREAHFLMTALTELGKIKRISED